MAPPTHLGLLDNIQKKALKIKGVDQITASTKLSIPSLTHRRQVATARVLYKIHTHHCPMDLQVILPPPYTRRQTTPLCAALCTDHGQDLHTVVCVWNSLPLNVVGSITDNGLWAFKCRVYRHLLNHMAGQMEIIISDSAIVDNCT